jgi:hypothetical protein
MVASAATPTQAEYGALVAEVRSIIESTTPPGATVVVVSKGDEALVALPGRRGWHFPRAQDGRYAGHYPADSVAAIMQLESLRGQGAEYLVVPSTSFWWLDYYDGLADHLDQNCEAVAHAEAAVVYALGGGVPHGEPAREPEANYLAERIGLYLESLLPDEAVVAVVSTGDQSLVALGREAWHFPRTPSGEYAGSVALDLDGAVRHAADLADRGASFLVVPSAESSWLDSFPGFVEELARRWRLVARQQHLCTIFDLTDPVGSGR